MADYLSRACRLQLTTAMESLIRTAVFEISQIFEDSLHDHQVELARKGEEIAYLKVKLQWAELRLREVSADNTTDQVINASLESPSVSVEPSPHQSSTAPDTDIDVACAVTDDWCVPLDPENVNKQENACPSVRLRQFSIPLFPIPLKHEAFSKLDSSNIGPRLNKDSAQPGLQEEAKPKRKRGRPRKIKFPLTVSESDKVKEGPQNIKEESIDNREQLTRRVGRRRRRFRIHKIPKLKRTNNTETKANSSVKGYLCRFCPKVFDTAFGLSVHDRAHKKCKGCKRIFPFPSVLLQHKATCKLYKKLMKSSKVSPESVANANPSGIKKDKPVVRITSNRKIKAFTCKCCHKKFDSRSLLLKHPCFISCQTCHKRLSNRVSLAVHIAKVHEGLADLKDLKCESWTKPLEEVEDGQENKLSYNKKSKGLYKKCPQGFKCLICKKVYISKYTAIEHTFVHTGERPLKCTVCLKSFSQRNALSHHRRKEHGMVIRKCKICACSKKFFAKSTYKEHKLICPKAGK